MKRYAKLLQMDERGQLVIPKDVREELNMSAGAGFMLYVLDDEAIVLKPVPAKDFSEHASTVREIEANVVKLKISKDSVSKAQERYRRQGKHNFDEV